MRKHKTSPKYHVVSMRVNNEEKLALEELMRHSSKSVSKLMREAIQLYTPHVASQSEQSP
jgi:predicted DNA-binding protein